LDSVRIIPVGGQRLLVPSLVQLTTTNVSGSGTVLIVVDADTTDESEIIRKKQFFHASWPLVALFITWLNTIQLAPQA
jgi:hypothetical protein